MSEESRTVGGEADKSVVPPAVSVANEDEVEDEAEEQNGPQDAGAGKAAKKKKSKKAKLKKALQSGDAGEASTSGKMNASMIKQILEMNPSLKSEIAGLNEEQIEEKLSSLDLSALLTGMVGEA